MQSPTLTKLNSYIIDPNHSTIHFWVRHMMVAKVHGELSDVVGSVQFDPQDLATASVEVKIDARTLTTRNDQRDGHLKSADFLDVEQFPEITFTSKRFVATTAGEYDVVGNLTIHGVTREVTFKAEATPEVKGHFGGYVIGISASGVINREDFGMTYNQALEAGGVLVGKEIHFQIDAELQRSE
jgi:polyisoprenoid-binding protein YceI